MVAITTTHHRPSKSKWSLRKCCYCFVGCMCVVLVLPLLFLPDFNPTTTSGQPWQYMEPAALSKLQLERMPDNSNDNDNQKPPDGYFNGFPVHLQTFQEEPILSSVHCVGDNYQADAWMQRSCSFHRLCYDLEQRDFVLLQSHRDQVLQRFLQYRPAMKTASAFAQNSTDLAVALGGINLKWSLKTQGPPSATGFKWFPRIVNATALQESGDIYYYALPSNTVMIPYHSLSAKNPGHLVWDDFLPIYTLMTMFQLQNRVILPLRVLLNQPLWSSCEASDDNEQLCQKMTRKFLSLLVGNNYPYNLTRADNAHFIAAATNPLQSKSSNLVCAPRGAAGLGALTDHGTKKLHGWMRDDYKTMHNHGRGALLYEFRNFMVHNLGLVPITSVRKEPPFKIVFSMASSDIPSRNLDFAHQIGTLQQNFPSTLVSVEAHVMKDLTVQQQVELATTTNIFITICGGGAVTGMFLPKGAAVILYYLEHGGVEYGVMTHLPAFLDWDLFNNMAHLRTHWLPTQTMDQRIDLRALVLLVQQELELMQQGILI